MKNRIEKIRCDVPGCTCIAAERRQDGTVIVRHKHHGEWHITIIEPLPQTTQQELLAGVAAKPATGTDSSCLP